MSINLNKYAQACKYDTVHVNLVPRACDPREGTRGSGIIRCRKPGILAKIELRIPFQRPIRFLPETDYPRASRSRGSQARGTRLSTCMCTIYIVLRHLVEHVVVHVEGSQLHLYSPITFRKTSSRTRDKRHHFIENLSQ